MGIQLNSTIKKELKNDTKEFLLKIRIPNRSIGEVLLTAKENTLRTGNRLLSNLRSVVGNQDIVALNIDIEEQREISNEWKPEWDQAVKSQVIEGCRLWRASGTLFGIRERKPKSHLF